MSSKNFHLFDFDGTLTKHSTVTPFVFASAQWGAIAARGPRLAPLALQYLVGRRGFDEMLRKSTLELLRGLTEPSLAFAGYALAGKLIDQGQIWGKTLDMYRLAIERGDEVAIVTGGYEYVAKAWLTKMGLSGRVFSSKIAWDATGGVSHCHQVCVGGEKLAAVQWARSLGGAVVAYGNSKGDHEMLSHADRCFWVGKDGSMSERSSADFRS